MSAICEVTGKRPRSGNNISHSHRRTRRQFRPNIQTQRFFLVSENRWIKLKVSAAGIKKINRDGIETVLAEMRRAGKKV
ncbi:MAG: large subunit ribosomal protein L28 [Glaciecola sp.]|jgi:large subunit ribosomal protein L28